jgi:hypothetical protein
VVKSNVRAMAKPKRKVVEIDPELIKEWQDLKRDIVAHKIEEAIELARAEETRRWLRLIGSRR